MAKRGKVKFPVSVESIDRTYHPRKYQYALYIYCEDEKTEVAYFDQFLLAFPERTVFLKTVGTGMDPLGVVNKAIEARSIHLDRFDALPDETWVVFDVDDADKDLKKEARFDQAITQAESHGIQIASSNEVFELWLLLHLQQVDPNARLPRQVVYQALQKAIQVAMDAGNNFEYRHGKADVIPVVLRLGDERFANQNAQALEAFWKSSGKKFLFTNPRTRVYQLVQRLRELIAYYSYES